MVSDWLTTHASLSPPGKQIHFRNILGTFLETLWKSEEQKSRSRCSVYCVSIPTEVEARYDKVIKWKIWSSLKFYYRWYFRLSQPDSDYTISTQHSQYLHMLSVFSGHGGLGRNMSSKMRGVFPQELSMNLREVSQSAHQLWSLHICLYTRFT